jgi:chromatin licensing and DNA replication factor 1
MAQGKVTNYFSTRKRTRITQDEMVLLNKSQKTTKLIETNTSSEEYDEIKMLKSRLAMISTTTQTTENVRCTRSQAKQQQLSQDPPAELPPPAQRKGGKKSKEQLEALKSKINKFNHDMGKVAPLKPETEPPQAPTEEPQESLKAPEMPAKNASAKRTVNSTELKQKIAQFNKNLLDIQSEFSDSSKTPKTASVEIAAPVAELPAYLKYKDLASSDLDPSTKLTLPRMYQTLLNAFKGSDTIIKMLFNRDEICTFLKLKKGIQNITKHDFTQSMLAQIKHVYPEAYCFKQEKMFIDFKNDYHLIVQPNLEEIELDTQTGLRRFTPNVLLLRLNKFESGLLQIVKKLHQAFLTSLGITEVSTDNVKRWHPKFNLESVQPIVESELPKPPKDESIKCKTGQELLNIAKVIYSSRIQDAINKSVTVNLDLKGCSDDAKKVPPKVSLPKAKTPTKKSDENLTADQQVISKLKEKKESSYNALLEKIKSKQKQKEYESMIVNSDKEKQLARYGHYKETIRFLMFHFQAEKKSVLEFDKVCSKMVDSSKALLTETECRDLVKSMSDDSDEINMFKIESKKWLNILKVRNVFYLQMDKKFQINDLHDICEKAIKNISQ